jgi:hypothetical protein
MRQRISKTEPYNEGRVFTNGSALKFFIIGLLFLVAFLIRLYHINRPPLDFQPIRQYQLAHVTRGYYFETLKTIPDWRREIAVLNKERMGFKLEPRIFDHMVVFIYRILDGEYLWIPRVMSSIFWMIGGLFLYLIAKKILTPEAALFSIIFYLFQPYGISASRSFQPDPLMVMLMILSMYMILRYHEQPSLLRLIITIAISSMAIFIKPYCIFIIFGSFITVAIYRLGIKGLFTNRDFLMFIFLTPLPGAAYYLSGVFTPGSFLREHAQASFIPHLLLRPYFWKNWLAMVLRVTGLIAFIGALLGLFMVQNKLSRFFLRGLWFSYFIYGLLFTFHIHTHDYYQLPFIPVIALSFGPSGAWLLRRMFSSKKCLIIFGIFLLILIYGINININKARQKDYDNYFKIFNYIVGTNPQFYKFLIEDFEKEVRISKEIGEIVNHSSKTLFLTPDYGRSLTYHGEISGFPWPTQKSLSERKLRGIKIPKKEELFDNPYFIIRTHDKFIKFNPDFFIITDFKEFESQPDLKEILTVNFSIIIQNDNYMIFDTREVSKNNLEKKE